jgi:hypothetical protein
MQIKIGNYAFQSNTASIAMDVRTNLVRGVPVSEHRSATIRGQLLTSDSASSTAARQADSTSKIRALDEARKVQGARVAVYQDNGNLAGHVLDPDDSIGGVFLESFRWLDAVGAEHVNYRSFELTIGGDFPVDGSGPIWLSWTETVQLIGTGGPRRITIETINGPVIRQTTTLKTKVRGLQTGRGIAWTASNPQPPGPYYPQDELLDERTIAGISPERIGNAFRNRGIQWTYRYEFVGPVGLYLPAGR